MTDREAVSQRWCRALMRRKAVHSFFATRFLPRRKREAAEAIYALVRTADDLADEPGIPNERRREGLDAIETAVIHLRDAEYACDAQWFPAARRTFARFPIAIEDVRKTLAAFRNDIAGVNYETLEDLERYGAMVSGAVARCAVAVLGVTDADALDRAERLGIAVQLSNILRDIDEDRKIGRNYLPRPLSNESEFDVIERVAERARKYYREAPDLAKRLPNDGSRMGVLLAANLYERALWSRISLYRKHPTR